MPGTALRAAHQLESPNRRVLHDFGYFGHYLWRHRDGRGGRQHVLKTLLAHDGRMGQRELLDTTSVTSASLSEVVSRLEAEGLVTRERSERDRRQVTLALTEEGTRQATEVVRARREFEDEALSCLSEEEVLELLGMLDRIFDHWRALEDQGERGVTCSRD